MPLNRIQMAIFAQLSREKDLEPDLYAHTYSEQVLAKQVDTLAQLSEEEADAWITRAYLESLE